MELPGNGTFRNSLSCYGLFHIVPCSSDPAVELILTGRGAMPELIALADLVTEMKKIKHPFDKGVPARQGIDY